jgi:serine/threonine-protein kinase HipA
MAPERRTVEVCADWRGLGGPTRVGMLHAMHSRGAEVFSFEYERAWLEGEPLPDPEATGE